MRHKIKIIILAFILCCYAAKINAQTEINITAGSKTYSETFDSLSTGLNPSRIPFGILYDRVYGWSGLDNFQNGDTTAVSRLLQGWYDLEQSYTNSNLRPNRYENMRKKVEQKIFAVQLPIITLLSNFSFIDSMAYSDGRIIVNNGMLIDNNGALPYSTKQIAMAGFGIDKVVANKNYALQLDTAITSNNTTYQIQSIDDLITYKNDT